jgi:hypothetical protein
MSSSTYSKPYTQTFSSFQILVFESCGIEERYDEYDNEVPDTNL